MLTIHIIKRLKRWHDECRRHRVPPVCGYIESMWGARPVLASGQFSSFRAEISAYVIKISHFWSNYFSHVRGQNGAIFWKCGRFFGKSGHLYFATVVFSFEGVLSCFIFVSSSFHNGVGPNIVFYIKPQRQRGERNGHPCCQILSFYIKPQLQ